MRSVRTMSALDAPVIPKDLAAIGESIARRPLALERAQYVVRNWQRRFIRAHGRADLLDHDALQRRGLHGKSAAYSAALSDVADAVADARTADAERHAARAKEIAAERAEEIEITLYLAHKADAACADLAALLDAACVAPTVDPRVAADRKALADAYRQGKADLPHVRPFAKAVQAATAAVLATDRSMADAASNNARRKIARVQHATRAALADAIAAFHAALDHAAESRIVDSRQLRDKPIGWTGRRDAAYRHVEHPIFENPNAKPWQV